ncbi:MAG: TolC family protein [Burkholderiales bacterium]|nr:TolC family protein [Burkholderiales bacterium]
MRPIILALGLAASLHVQAQTFADVFNKAWSRQPQARAQSSREAELKANQVAASTLFAAPPTLGLGHRTDQFNRNVGSREYEVDVSVPIWLPGEKAARQNLAASDLSRLTADQTYSRLQLAGELREAIWQVRLAENAKALAKLRLDSAKQIESDVARRVKAGDLAKADLLLAQGESLAAQGSLADADRQLLLAKQAYKRLVGDEQLPALEPEKAAANHAIDTHPTILAWQHRLSVAKAKTNLVAHTGRDNPEVSIGMRRERGDFNERYGNTVAVTVKIPFGSDARNAPRIAAAQADALEAETELERQKYDVEQGIQKARAELDLAKQQAAWADSRVSLASENLQLIKKAFSFGERSLVDYQRTQAAFNEAALAAGQAKLNLHRVYARLNQAMGVLP